jgi:hypothetical protein
VTLARSLTDTFATEGALPLPGTPEDYAADIDHEETMWACWCANSI